jgi:hypothetical protein
VKIPDTKHVVRAAIFVTAVILLTTLGESPINNFERLAESPGGFAILVTLYAIALSIPFVPGVEIGILLMWQYGVLGVVIVYLASVLGLMADFSARSILHKSSRLGPFRRRWSSQFDRLIARRPGRKYLAMGVLLNLPGNTLVGGGGGCRPSCRSEWQIPIFPRSSDDCNCADTRSDSFRRSDGRVFDSIHIGPQGGSPS